MNGPAGPGGPVIPCWTIRVANARGPLIVWTFREVPRVEPDVWIQGPPGTAVHRGAGREPPKLKVPQAGRPGEFHLMSAMEAADAALHRRYGLELALPPRSDER